VAFYQPLASFFQAFYYGHNESYLRNNFGDFGTHCEMNFEKDLNGLSEIWYLIFKKMDFLIQ